MDSSPITQQVTKEQVIPREHVENKQSYLFFKRLSDIIVSAIALIVLFPLFLLIAIFIKLEDPKGPVFFSQTRIGKDEKEFKMFKFRSMCVDAEERLAALLQQNEIEGAMFKMKEDPRITKIGKFIRKTSIDELPQFWNVLKGDMSVVGPRPPLPREVSEYTAYEKQRLLVTPGCTGLWQVSGRNQVSFYDMVELDLEYIHKRSYLFDVKIIFKTFGELINSKDAY